MKVKHPEMTKEYPIFEWIPGIQIVYQADIEHIPHKQIDKEEALFHSNEHNDIIT